MKTAITLFFALLSISALGATTSYYIIEHGNYDDNDVPVTAGVLPKQPPIVISQSGSSLALNRGKPYLLNETQSAELIGGKRVVLDKYATAQFFLSGPPPNLAVTPDKRYLDLFTRRKEPTILIYTSNSDTLRDDITFFRLQQAEQGAAANP